MALLRSRLHLPPNFWSGTQLSLAVRIVILSVALVGNGVTAWRIITEGPDGFGSATLELTLCVLDLLVWAVLAWKLSWAWVPVLVLQLGLAVTQTAPGSLLAEFLVVMGFLAYGAARHALLIPLASTVALTFLTPSLDDEVGSAFVSGYLAMLVVALLVGLSMRFQMTARKEDHRLIEDFERRTVELIQAQRDELARELHDIVAHDLTVIAMQSSAGAMKSDGSQRETFEVIADSARGALGDLRRLLRLMREPESSEEVASSAANIDLAAELSELAASLEDLNHEVTTSVEGNVQGVPYGVRTTIARVLREGTTNILKHAPGRCSVRLHVAVGANTVTAEVENQVRDAGAPASRRRFGASGFGVIGLRERAQLLGGELEAGPVSGGGWRLQVTIPLQASE